ncbi:MAG: PEP-CTERM sorting domain-containing protein [Phycisphaerae bacterium]|nr:PEP-CTERM sorting domain-containing protein [Phycisphaerae bacterium]
MVISRRMLLAAATAVVCASTGFIRQTEAYPITYEMTGSVVYSGIAGINADEPFQGKFTYDTDMPLVYVDEIATGRWGVYHRAPPNQPLGMSVTFGTRTVATSNSTPLYLTVFDAISAQRDSFELLGGGLSDPAFSHLEMMLALRAPGQNEFSSIQMPASLDLAALPVANVFFSVPGELAPPVVELDIETLSRRYVFTPFDLRASGESFGDAIANGNIQPVAMGEQTEPAMQFFTAQVLQDDRVDAFEQVEVRLTPDSPADVAGSDGMVVSWDHIGENILHLSSWDFTYDQDPDFTNTEISFSVLPPEGITHLGMELIDVNGHSRGWMLSDPEHILGEYSILADLAQPQSPFTSFFFDEADFDITQVLSIRFTESSIGGAPFRDPDPAGDGDAWSAWGRLSVQVIPEPSTLALAGMGLVVTILAAKRLRPI